MKEEDTEEEKKTEEDTKPEKPKEVYVKRVSRQKYNPDYHKPEFVEKLGTYYVTTQNYAETARMLNEEFKTSISKDQVKYIYFKKMSKKITHDPKAGEFFDDAFNKMKDRWKDAWEMVGDLVKQYKILRNRLGEETDTQKALMFMKMAPTILQISEGIRKQLEFIQKQQEQIKISQETLIFSPTQINQQITPIIKTLVDEGKIAILQDIPEWEIDKKERKKKEKKK